MLNKYIDHTLLKPEATESQITKLCEEAKEHHFYAVCINGSYVPLAKKLLTGTDVKVVAVIGFPLGAMDTASKVFEAENCVKNGADEIDMVINIGWLQGSIRAKDKQTVIITYQETVMLRSIITLMTLISIGRFFPIQLIMLLTKISLEQLDSFC